MTWSMIAGLDIRDDICLEKLWRVEHALHLEEIRSDQPTVSSFGVKNCPHKIRIVSVQPKIGSRTFWPVVAVAVALTAIHMNINGIRRLNLVHGECIFVL